MNKTSTAQLKNTVITAAHEKWALLAYEREHFDYQKWYKRHSRARVRKITIRSTDGSTQCVPYPGWLIITTNLSNKH